MKSITETLKSIKNIDVIFLEAKYATKDEEKIINNLRQKRSDEINKLRDNHFNKIGKIVLSFIDKIKKEIGDFEKITERYNGGDGNTINRFFGVNDGSVNYYDGKKWLSYNFHIKVKKDYKEKFENYLKDNKIDYQLDDNYEYRFCINLDNIDKLQKAYKEKETSIFNKYTSLIEKMPKIKNGPDFDEVKDEVQDSLDEEEANIYFDIYCDELLDYTLYPVIPELIKAAGQGVFMKGKCWFLHKLNMFDDDEKYEDVIPHQWNYSDNCIYDDCVSSWKELNDIDKQNLIDAFKNYK